MTYAIQAEGLAKRYGETRALDGVDLEVPRGRLLGVLGPNGAGKTTAVRVLATLLRPDAGRAEVAGFDVVRQAHQVRSLIGLTGQYAAVDETLTGVENLVMIGRLLDMPRAEARRRAAELLDRFNLTEAGGRAAKTYSGGMRRRLDLAASLVGRPQLLFLDEPTTGLDPRSRADLWAVVRGLRNDGVTVLLILGLGMVLGFRVHTGVLGVVGALALLLAFALAMSWAAVLIGLTAENQEKVQIMAFSLMMPITFTSNAFVPTDTMPSWLQKWVEINPVTHLADAVRGLLSGGPVASSATVSLLWAAGLAAVFAPLSIRAFRNRT
ncbi:ATP-binding cassette domain-containing protein [Microtetraspora sp. NBRC 16547]|uniref:ATP-binding cassette domain-containing protein n=1 Tax=Microtetraspora sp. NBRC 16547 TaxID=3030993 RepID=UPI0024A480E9|nr:ATP-binding cassette domain-containing protein [Microtetraspora sp. NBRC 16547]GLW96563.1 hypothetical protein Misp02_06500 [Microtetraspora sp. NBRC 16547]